MIQITIKLSKKNINVISENKKPETNNLEKFIKSTTNNSEKSGKRFSMPDRRKGYIQKATIGDHKVYLLANMRMAKLVKFSLTQVEGTC